MPQMMPLWWLTLMIFFISNFYCMNNLMYYYTTPQINLRKMHFESNNINWKW